jgi:DNA mismatch repair protein MutS
VLDEIGRGTSTYDGLAIAWAVAEYLHDVVGCRAMFATHYHELTELAESRAETCENWSVSAREHEGDLVFLHKLQRGAASRSYGVACARLAGVPESVVARARALLQQFEQGPARLDTPSPAPPLPDVPKPQLDLFCAVASASPTHPVLDTVRAVDLDRLTPLDAFALVVAMKKMASPS